MTNSIARTGPTPRAFDTILYGGLIAGTLDAIDGVVALGLKGMNPIQILQYIASGLLGADSFKGGLAFTHPQGGRVQIPISSGVVSKDAVTFAGQNQFPMGGSIEVTFNGNVSGTTLSGTADMTSRSMLLGPATETASLNLTKQ